MRLLTILHSTAPREAGRLDLGLTRGLFLAGAFLVLLPAAAVERSMPPAGLVMYAAFSVASLLLAVFLAARLGGDGVGDVRSGLLPLAFMAGVRPQQWLAVRLVQMWAGFASVWIVRAPLLLYVFTLGGLSITRLLVTEILLLLTFLILSSLALLGSFQAKSRQQVFAAMLPLMAWEFALVAPGFFAALLARYYNWSVSTRTLELFDTIARLGFSAHGRAALWSTPSLSDCWPTVGMYVLLAGLVLQRYCSRLSAVSRGADILSEENAKEAARTDRRSQRESRRCWDDALAWQAYCIHGSGRRLVKVKCVLYALIGLTLLLSLALPGGYFELVFCVAAAMCLIFLLISMGKPSDCLTREIREETLPVLLLTPHDPEDYYAGWKRGALRLAWPEIVLAAVLACVSYALDPVVPVIVVSVTAAILSNGPFLMLSPLVPYTFAGIATGLGLTFAAVFIVGVSIGCGATVHPIAAPLVLIPLACLFNFVLRKHILPYWMQAKISSIV